MKSTVLFFLFSLILLQSDAAAQVDIPATSLPVLRDGSLLVEDFSGDETGQLPVRWFNQTGDAIPANYEMEIRESYNYKVIREGTNQFLRFDGIKGKHLNFPLVDVENFNIEDYPVLSWKWRVHTLPEGANENDNDRNDVAASIYVVYSVNWLNIPRVIRYTWSSSLPVGTELSKNFNNQKIVVVASGEEQTGEWITFERNIREDYRQLYNRRPPDKPIAVLILSDGISTGTPARADYDDIHFKPLQ